MALSQALHREVMDCFRHAAGWLGGWIWVVNADADLMVVDSRSEPRPRSVSAVFGRSLFLSKPTRKGGRVAESLERRARNQTLFREVNEQILKTADDHGTSEFVCECSNTDCIEVVELRYADYEHIRAHSTWL